MQIAPGSFYQQRKINTAIFPASGGDSRLPNPVKSLLLDLDSLEAPLVSMAPFSALSLGFSCFHYSLCLIIPTFPYSFP